MYFETVDLGRHEPDGMLPYLEDMIGKAKENGLPRRLHRSLADFVEEYADLFRVRLGPDPPANIPPMKIILKQDSVPARVKVVRYAPLQCLLLRKTSNEIRSLGLIYPNNTLQWACAPLIVPKLGREQFRFSVDLRPANFQTVLHIWPMPDLEQAIVDLANDVCYSSLDLCKGYWQLPPHPESQECQSFMSSDGVFTPTRVLHVHSNAVSYFQSSFQSINKEIRENVLNWPDDMLIHCHFPDHLLDVLRSFFVVCRKNNFKLHAKMCKLFLEKVIWRGRIVSREGVRLDPQLDLNSGHVWT